MSIQLLLCCTVVITVTGLHDIDEYIQAQLLLAVSDSSFWCHSSLLSS